MSKKELYSCGMCGETFPAVYHLIKRHVCKQTQLSVANLYETSNLNEPMINLHETPNLNEPVIRPSLFFEIFNDEMKKSNYTISLNLNGVIIEGKVVAVNKETERIVISDSYNQKHVLTFDCVKKNYTGLNI
jgi:hypothetical protein